MGIASTTSTIAYAGNNSTVTEYVVPFYFLAATDLRVVVATAAGVETTLTSGSGFTATGAGDESGGELTTSAAYDNTHTVTIYREVSATQATEYNEGASFPAASHETALDKLTMLVQQCLRKIGKCFRLSEASADLDAIEAVDAVSRIIGIDEDGEAVLMTGDDILTLLSLPETIVDAPTAYWNSDAERAAKVPDFQRQVGVQYVGTYPLSLWISTGTSAGQWTPAKPTDGIVVTASLATNAVTTVKITDLNVTTGKLADLAVTTAKIADANVTAAKMGTVGMVLQSVSTTYTTNTNLTAFIPRDNTIPQSTEGTQILSVAITPTSTANKMRIRFSGIGAHDGTNESVVAALFNGGSNSLHTVCAFQSVADQEVLLSLDHITAAVGTVSPITYSIRVGAQASTIRMNGTTGGALFGGTAACYLIVEEIKA